MEPLAGGDAACPLSHRQVVLAVPQRLRPYFRSNRGLLGDLSRVAARTITAFIRATTGERNLAVGIVAAIQTHGSRANGHPHVHLLVTDGGFRPDGTFVPLPLHDVATVTEGFRRAGLQRLVRRGLLDTAAAAGMLAWPHSGVHVHDGVWVPAEDRAFATRLARCCARHPVALNRLAYRADTGTVTYQSDKPRGPTAGAETVDALAFLARVVSHIPNNGQVLQRYDGWDANRPRGIRRKIGFHEPPAAVAADVMPPALADGRRRWAELLRRIFEVDPLRCPRCGDAMRVVGFSTQPHVIDRRLTPLRRQAPPARRARAPPPHRTAACTASSA